MQNLAIICTWCIHHSQKADIRGFFLEKWATSFPVMQRVMSTFY